MMVKNSSRGYTLIEVIIVIVILAIVSGITINFLVSSLKIYTMTVNQKTLLDQGKLALERMCRDIRDAKSITSPAAGGSGGLITFVRTNATAQDNAGDIIIFQTSSGTLQRVNQTRGDNPGFAMAGNVSAFTVTLDTSSEVKLQLTLSFATGENVTLQTKVYPKNFAYDATETYNNFFQNWMEALSP